MTATEYLKSHRAIVIEAYEEAEGSPKATWENLIRVLPDIGERMKFNTFRTYLGRVVDVSEPKEREALDQGVTPSAESQAMLDEATKERDAARDEAIDRLVELHHLKEEYIALGRECYTLVQELETGDNLWSNLQDEAIGHLVELHRLKEEHISICRECYTLMEELSRIRKERDELQARLETLEVTPSRDNEPGTIPKRFEGWTVQQNAADRKIRLFRRIGGRLHTVYIGVAWNAEKAMERIQEKLSRMV